MVALCEVLDNLKLLVFHTKRMPRLAFEVNATGIDGAYLG